MSKMHSWPPMEQGIERPMSDLDPVFSVPVLPKILCTVPEGEPAPMCAPLAKPGNPYAEAAAALDGRRQAEELRRVLRSMYKDHFQMQTEVRCGCSHLPMTSHEALLGRELPAPARKSPMGLHAVAVGGSVC